MKVKVFCVHDSKVGAYMQPFFFQSRGQALRAWETTVNDPEAMFSKYPGDFTLFEVAEYDESVGQFINYEAKVSLGTALDFKKKPAEAMPLFQGGKNEVVAEGSN